MGISGGAAVSVGGMGTVGFAAATAVSGSVVLVVITAVVGVGAFGSVGRLLHPTKTSNKNEMVNLKNLRPITNPLYKTKYKVREQLLLF